MVSTGRGVPRDSRYARVAGLSRRSFLTAVIGAATGLLAACTRSDEEVFADLGSDGRVPAETGSSRAGTDTTDRAPGTLRVQDPDSGSDGGGADSGNSSTTGDDQGNGSSSSTRTTAPDSAESTTPTTDTAPAATAGNGAAAIAPGQDLVVAFTYQQLPGGKNVPPYIAVWIEDAAGGLVETVALWYQQFGRGERWLPDLRRWFGVDQQRMAEGGSDGVAAVSGPTRQPGSYQVAWAGRVDGGATAPAGTYHICIESARERGPYSLIRQSVELNGSSRQIELPSDNELVDASVRTG
jgi:hypothetical protein